MAGKAIRTRTTAAGPSRSQRFAQQPAPTGMGVVGIIGWIVAVCAIVLVVAVTMMSSRKAAYIRSANYAKLQAEEAQLKQNTKALDARRTELDKKLDAIRVEEKELARSLRELKDSEDKLTRKNDALNRVVTQYQSQFSVAKAQLGFSYATIEEFLKAHKTAMANGGPKKPAATPTVTVRTPDPVATSNPAWVVRAPDNKKAEEPAPRVTINMAPAAPDDGKKDEPEKTEYVQPDEKFLRLDCETKKKSKDTGDYYWENRTELVTLTVNIKNGNFHDDYNGMLLYVVIIGRNVNDRSTYQVLDKAQKTVDVKAREEVEAYSGEIRNTYDDSDYYKYGYKYDGYLVVLCDRDGKPLADSAVRSSYSKYREKIIKFNRGSFFNSKGDPVTNLGY